MSLIRKSVDFKKSILLLVIGVPGSGKTTIARALCRVITNCSYLSKDMFQGVFTSTRLETEEYERVRKPTVKFFLTYAKEQLQFGKSVIIDAPYSINKWRGDEYADFANIYKNVAVENNSKFIIIRCKPLSIEKLKKDIAKRNYPRDQWKLKNWDLFLEREPIDIEVNYKYVIDVIADFKKIEKSVEEVIKYIKKVLTKAK